MGGSAACQLSKSFVWAVRVQSWRMRRPGCARFGHLTPQSLPQTHSSLVQRRRSNVWVRKPPADLVRLGPIRAAGLC